MLTFGKDQVPSEGLPFHQGVTDFGNRFVADRVYSTALNRVAEPGDILCSVRAPVGRLNVTLGKIVIGRGLAAIRSKTSHQSLLLQQLRSHFFKEDLIGGGAIFASVTKKEFSAQELLEPPERLKRSYRGLYKKPRGSGHVDEDAYAGRNNLPFVTQPSYNYDREIDDHGNPKG